MDRDDLGAFKKNLRRGATLLFCDESGYALIPFLVRTWARAGTIPVLRHPFGTWDKLSVTSAVALRLRRGRLELDLYFRTLPDAAFTNEDIAAWLAQLARHLRGRVDVVWDNASQHKGAHLREWFTAHPRFTRVPLPPYCPELNPDEGVWNWSKTKALGNAAARDSGDLLRLVRRSLRQLRHRKDVLAWCLAKSELPWGRLLNQRVGV